MDPPSPVGDATSSLPPPPPPPSLASRRFPTARWGLGDALAALGVYVAVGVVVAVAFVAVEDTDSNLTGPWLPAFVLLPQLLVLGYVWLAVDRKGRGPRADLDLRFEWLDVPIGVAIALGGMIAAGLVGTVVAEIVGDDPTAAVAELVEDSEDGGGITVWIVLVAVLGATVVPLTEELLFRGLWWNALVKRGGSEIRALVLTSVIFAAFHLELVRAPVLLVLGLALGWGRLWTGRLGASVVAHVVVNALSFTVLVIELA